MKTTTQFDLEIAPDSFRSACDISRACRPTWEAPHIAVDLALGNERGDRIDDHALDGARADERLGDFQRLLAAVRLGHEQRIDVHAQRLGVDGVERMGSASMNAASPPAFCTSPMMCSATVVLPDDSGPYISMMRPLGTPPMPSAISSDSDPVDTPLTSIF